MSACEAPGGSIMAIGLPGATRIITKTMIATPKSVISVVTLRVRTPRSAFIASLSEMIAAVWPVPHPRSGGGGPPKAVEGANDGRGALVCPLHHAAHGPPPPSKTTGEEPSRYPAGFIKYG